MKDTEIHVRDNISRILHRLPLEKLKQTLAFLNGLAQSDYDWADELTEEQLQLIEIGKQQIQNEQYLSSEEVHAGVKALIERAVKENKGNK